MGELLLKPDDLWAPSARARQRIASHPMAAMSLIQHGHTRRTVVCAAGFNTPMWQAAVERCYPQQEPAR